LSLLCQLMRAVRDQAKTSKEHRDGLLRAGAMEMLIRRATPVATCDVEVLNAALEAVVELLAPLPYPFDQFRLQPLAFLGECVRQQGIPGITAKACRCMFRVTDMSQEGVNAFLKLGLLGPLVSLLSSNDVTICSRQRNYWAAWLSSPNM
jgi:hypothetical protein